MKKLLTTLLMLTMVACSGTAGIQIADEAVTDAPKADAAQVTPDAAPAPAPTNKVAPDSAAPTPDAGVTADAAPDATPDAGVDAAPDAADAGPVVVDPPVDPPPPPPPPVCQVRGSCQVSPAVCMEFEDNGVQLAKEKAKCVGAMVWSDAPCNRANTVGQCKANSGFDILCPKYEVVYSAPANPVTAANACANIPGVFVP